MHGRNRSADAFARTASAMHTAGTRTRAAQPRLSRASAAAVHTSVAVSAMSVVASDAWARKFGSKASQTAASRAAHIPPICHASR